MDLDLFDDTNDASKNARAGAKFQPRAKSRLPKRGLAAAPLVPCSQQLQVQTTEQTHKGQNPLNPDDERNSGIDGASSEHAIRTDFLDSVVDLHTDIDVSVSGSNEKWEACFGRSAGENSDIFTGLESLGDFIPESASVLDNAIPSSGAPASHVPSSRDAGEGHGEPLIQGGDGSDGLFQVSNIDPESKSSLAEDPLARDAFIVVDPVPIQYDMQSVPPGCDLLNQNTVPDFTQDNVPDFCSVGPSDGTPPVSVSEILVDGEQRNGATNFSDAEVLGEHINIGPKAPAKLASQRTKTIKSKTCVSDNVPNQQGDPASNLKGVASRSLRKRKNCDSFHQLVDEPEDEAASVHLESHPRNEPEKKRAKKESNKPLGDDGKQVRKRKRDNQKSDETAKAAPKKFSHSTRRRRTVDKTLLENPDNIDVRKVPFRDLILLAEHKERTAFLMQKKEATAAQATLPNQSQAARDNEDGANDTFQEHDEEEGFAFEETGLAGGESFFNYQTFMKRTRGPRWSKQDTELFYEAVQQFGTDLSMIQQLFPERTRRQIKLKYKKEERQHPLRLREALVNRAKGHTQFEVVIERLRQIAAKEKENSNKDDSSNLEEDEAASEARDGEEMSVHADEENVEELEIPEDEGVPEFYVKSNDDDEDELFRWDQYKSELMKQCPEGPIPKLRRSSWAKPLRFQKPQEDY